jgi:hypothetical protein
MQQSARIIPEMEQYRPGFNAECIRLDFVALKAVISSWADVTFVREMTFLVPGCRERSFH